MLLGVLLGEGWWPLLAVPTDEATLRLEMKDGAAEDDCRRRRSLDLMREAMSGAILGDSWTRGRDTTTLVTRRRIVKSADGRNSNCAGHGAIAVDSD